jgi:hypothetical protein
LKADIARAVIDRLNSLGVEKSRVVGRGGVTVFDLPAEHHLNRLSRRQDRLGFFCHLAGIHEIFSFDRDGKRIERSDGCVDLPDGLVRIVVGKKFGLELLAAANQQSPLGARLKARGPSPFAATLRGAKGPAPLDPNLTCGAALSFE